MASHVLEHVADQPAFLRRLFGLLRPGGSLWLALPNPDSRGLEAFGAAWHALHPPYHLCVPSRMMLEDWLCDVGFEKLRFMRRGAHVRRVWRLSQAIAARERLTVPGNIMLKWLRVLADLSATISSRRAEEIVVMACKPNVKHDD